MNYSRTILHVDDDPLITRFVAARLRAIGYEVTSVNDPRQALDEHELSQQRLVLLDIDMPHISGIDLLGQIKAINGGTQVIMLTSMVTMSTVLKSYRMGAEYCIFKPILDMDLLIEAIDSTFLKIDHWWSALERLSIERQGINDASEFMIPG